MSNKKGFTLIELLVVIAIIGILASVVLASLNSARTKGADAAIKANLANIRAQAALYYDTNTSYGTSIACTIPLVTAGTSTGCTSAFLSGGTSTMYEGLRAAGAASGVPAYGATNTAGDGWVAAARLKTDTGTYYCVDSNGAGKVVTGTLSAISSAATVACP